MKELDAFKEARPQASGLTCSSPPRRRKGEGAWTKEVRITPSIVKSSSLVCVRRYNVVVHQLTAARLRSAAAGQ